MKKKYLRIVLAAAVVVAAAAFLAQALWPIAVEAETLATGDVSDSLTVQGRVAPVHSQIVNAACTGSIIALPFTAGMPVQQGETLAELSESSAADLVVQREQLQQQLAAARYQYQLLSGSAESYAAALELAENQYQQASSEWQATQQIEQELGGVYSASELAAVENAMLAAEQNLLNLRGQDPAAGRGYYATVIESTQQQLAALDAASGGGVCVAPYDGVIWELYAEPGAFVLQNQPLLKIYQGDAMKIEVSLLSEDAFKLRVGDTAECRLADGTGFTARVSFISAVAEEVMSSIGIAEQRCTVELSGDQIPAGLGAGYELDVVFTTLLATDVLSVPASAIVPIDNGSAVYVDDNGRAALREIVTGSQGGGRVEVSEGLEPGLRLIINPYDAEIKDGSRVKAEQ